ncbi:hypothetical protein L4C36_21760 [Photobacterium japonica]|uniref:hypothetical protein n=1 Tax=Photobacterium japonica TaxID=2910235 RepID=UPI003D106870
MTAAEQPINEKKIVEYFAHQGGTCARPDAILWVLQHWPELESGERTVTPTMLSTLYALIRSVPTGKQRLYRQAFNDVLLYLAQACQWSLPDSKTALLHDNDLLWFERITEQAQFAEQLMQHYDHAKAHFLRHRPALEPAWVALVIALEVGPISLHYLAAILNDPQSIDTAQFGLTIKVTHLGQPSSQQETPAFTRYGLTPFAYRVLSAYYRLHAPALSVKGLVKQLNLWVNAHCHDPPPHSVLAPTSLPTRSTAQWHHAFQILWHYRDDLPPTLLKDMANPSRHVGFNSHAPSSAYTRRALARLYDQDWDKTWFEGLTPSTRRSDWPHLELLRQYARQGRRGCDSDTCNSYAPPRWEASNVLPVLFYHYTDDLIRYGGVKKALLSASSIRKYTGIYEKLTAMPLRYADAIDPSALMAWAHRAYDALESDTHRLMLLYFFRSLRHHPLTDHFDLSAFSPPTLPIQVDAFRISVSELHDVIHALLTQPGATPFQSLFSCLGAMLGYFAMLRRGEILRLRLKDIYCHPDHKQRFRLTLTSTVEGDTKNRRTRIVYTVIPEELAHLLRIALYIKASCPADTPLIGYEGEKMSSRQLHYLLPVTRALKALLGPAVRIHHLRHSGAHLLYLQGMALLYPVQPTALNADPHTQRLLTSTVCQQRFDYWLEGRDFTQMNDNLIFDVMGKQLGHAHYATTRLSYLHGVEWLRPIIQPDGKPYSHSELRYVLGLSPTSNDISRQLSRLSADYANRPLAQKKGSPVMLSEQVLSRAVLKHPQPAPTNMAAYDEIQTAYDELWQQQFLKQHHFLGQRTLDMLKKSHLNFSELSALWQHAGRHAHAPLTKPQQTALNTLKASMTALCHTPQAITIELACNQKNATAFTTLIRQPQWQWLAIHFVLICTRKINASRQLAIAQQGFARRGEAVTQKKIATGQSRLAITLSPNIAADASLMPLLLRYLQLDSLPEQVYTI